MNNWFIWASAHAALESDYVLTLLKDAYTIEMVEFDDGDIIEAESIVRELNVTMIWLIYPSRTTKTASVDAIDFPGST